MRASSLSLTFHALARQTETGSIVVTPFPGAIETKPGSAAVPFYSGDSSDALFSSAK